MNQQPSSMFGSTAACSVNVPSTSSLAHQQASSGAVPNPTMYYVSQISTDPYGQQIIQYGDSFGQEQIYPSKEMYASPNNTFARLPNAAYSYNNTIPPAQNEFAPQFQPPPLASQNNSTAAQQLIQPQQNQQFGAGQQHPVVQSLMHQPPPKTAGYPKRGPEQPQTYPINYNSNSVPAFNSPTAPVSYPPQMNQPQQKVQNPQNNGNSTNGQDQRSSRLFDNTTDNYTASWVSSTSSIPPEQKIPPDHNSRHNSPTGFEFTAWNAELSKLNDASTQNAAVAANNQQIPNLQQVIQPTHAYAGQSVQPMTYYAPNQAQFAPPGGIGYYPMQVPAPYIGFPPPQYVMPNALPAAIPNYAMPTNFSHQQFVSPALVLHQPPLNPLWPPDARPLENTQDSRFENTWLDQNKCTQQELDIQREVIPFALDHNQRQFNAGHSGSRNGLLSTITQQQSLNGGNESGFGESVRNPLSGHRKPFNPKRGTGGINRNGGGSINTLRGNPQN